MAEENTNPQPQAKPSFKPKASQPTASEQEPKVVILHTAVGQFMRGQVLPASTFGTVDRVLHLCNTKAIRMANEMECKLDRVDLDAVPVAATNETAELRETVKVKQAIIEQQERKIQMLENIQLTQAAASTSGATNAELMKRLKQDESTIAGLQKELDEVKAKLAELKQ